MIHHTTTTLAAHGKQEYEELVRTIAAMSRSEHSATSIISAVLAVYGEDALDAMHLLMEESLDTDDKEIIDACRRGPLDLLPTVIG